MLATGSVEDKNKQRSSLDLSEVGKSEGSKPEEGSTPQLDHCERCIRGWTNRTKVTHNKSLMTDVWGTAGAIVCADVDPKPVATLCKV